jgi:hypothetical protein
MLGDEVRQTASSSLQKCALMFRKPRLEQQRNDCDSDLFANVVVVLDPIGKISGGLADIATGRLGHRVINVRKFHFGSLFLAASRPGGFVAQLNLAQRDVACDKKQGSDRGSFARKAEVCEAMTIAAVNTWQSNGLDELPITIWGKVHA